MHFTTILSGNQKPCQFYCAALCLLLRSYPSETKLKRNQQSRVEINGLLVSLKQQLS